MAKDELLKARVQAIAARRPDWSSEQILQELRRQYPEWPEEELPKARTVRSWLPLVPRKTAERWSLLTAGPGEAVYVLPILASLLEEGGPADYVTPDEARWIARLGPAAAGMAPRQLLLLAGAYLRHEQDGQDTRSLDLGLALAPWRDGAERYARAFEAGAIRNVTYILIDQTGIERMDRALDAVAEKVKS